MTSTEPRKAFETTAQDLFRASVSTAGLLLHTAVGNSDGLGLRFPKPTGLAVSVTWRAPARGILTDVDVADLRFRDAHTIYELGWYPVESTGNPGDLGSDDLHRILGGRQQGVARQRYLFGRSTL